MSSFQILTSFSTSENKASLREFLFNAKSQEQKHLQSYLSMYQLWSHSQCNWEQEHGEAVQSSCVPEIHPGMSKMTMWPKDETFVFQNNAKCPLGFLVIT